RSDHVSDDEGGGHPETHRTLEPGARLARATVALRGAAVGTHLDLLAEFKFRLSSSGAEEAAASAPTPISNADKLRSSSRRNDGKMERDGHRPSDRRRHPARREHTTTSPAARGRRLRSPGTVSRTVA